MESFSFADRAFWEASLNPVCSKLAGLKQSIRSILDLTVSNPTQCGFKYLNEDLLEPLRAERANLEYHPDPHGTEICRRAIQNYYLEKGVRILDEQIFITANTSEAYSFIFKLLANPGDTLLAPQPSYPLIDYLGGLHDLSIERYLLESEESILSPLLQSTLQARAFLAVQPNNPTGQMLQGSLSERLLSQLSRLSCPLISDEVFIDYCHSPELRNKTYADEKRVLTFTVSGISKVLGLPQMKLSWIVMNGPDALLSRAIQKMEIIADTYLSASIPIQTAAPHWFAKKEEIQNEIRKRITLNLDQMRQHLPDSALSCLNKFEGGWAIPVPLSPRLSDEDWAIKFLEEDRMLVHPGYLFDFPEGSSYISISLLTPPDLFHVGLQKIAAQISSIRG